jgi:hypothetical protein
VHPTPQTGCKVNNKLQFWTSCILHERARMLILARNPPKKYKCADVPHYDRFTFTFVYLSVRCWRIPNPGSQSYIYSPRPWTVQL